MKLKKMLTKCELRVLEEFVKGKRNKEIGQALDLAEKTVKLHLTKIYKKAGLTSHLKGKGRMLLVQLLTGAL